MVNAMIISLYRHWLGTLSNTAHRIIFGYQGRGITSRRRKAPLAYGATVERLDQRIVPAKVLMPVTNPSDMIYDATRNVVYLPSQGKIERWDIATQSLLTPWNVGGTLAGGDTTPDDHYLYVADYARVGGSAIVHKVDLTNGQVTNLVVDSLGGNLGAVDLSISSNGTGFVTMSADGSSDVNLWQFDLATDTFTVRDRVWENTFIARSADRSLLAFENGVISSGPFFTYSAATDTISTAIGTGPFASFSHAVNHDGSLISYAKGGQDIKIYDSNLQQIIELNALDADGAHAFDPFRNILYAMNSNTDQILAIDTTTWTLLFSLPFGSDLHEYGKFMISGDGAHLYFTRGELDNFQFDIPAPLTARIGDLTLNESSGGAGTVTLTVTLSAPSLQSITIAYATSNGTATAGSDFTSTSGTVTFLPNQTVQTISIPIAGDTVVEPNETFHVTLSNPTNAVIAKADALVTLLNDDSGAPPALSGFAPTVTFLENTVNSAAQLIDNTVSFTDPDTPNLQGGQLTVSITAGGGVNDVLGIRHQGTGVGTIGISGSTLTYGGVPFATFTNNGSLTVTFTSASATPAAIDALIETLTYRNSSNTPAASRTISIVVTDVFGTSSVPAVSNVIITPESDPPTISAISAQSTSEDGSTTVPFTIDDDETPVGSLIVSATSSNAALLPDVNILVGGSGANRTLTLTPLPNQSGASTITVTVNDGGLQATRTFQFTVGPLNDPPAISDVLDVSINEDTSTGLLNFSVSDIDTSPVNLTVTGASSNLTLVPLSGIAIVGTGANRTVQITPAANQTGSTTITLTVNDGSATSIDTFVVTVAPLPDPPTISHIADRNTNEDTPTPNLSFIVGDLDSPATGLTVTAVSSNPELVPNANLVLAGTGTNRTLTVIPLANLSGVVTVTLTVSDGVLSMQDSFVVTVVPVDDPPTITPLADQSMFEDFAPAALEFTLADVDTPLGALSVSATSSNATLVPNGNLTLEGSGANRTITVTPTANAFGSTTITLSVTNGVTIVTETFVVVVIAVDEAPTITEIADRAINEDGTTGAISFAVADEETATSSLTITVSSSNPTLVPNANLLLGGSGGSRTVTATPLSNQSGSTEITVMVNDGAQTTLDKFILRVDPVNDAPNLSTPVAPTINEDSATAALPFTITDLETPLNNLVVTATSSNQALISNGNLSLGGTAGDRTIKVTPAANQSGVATITVNVNDGQVTTSTTFVVTVLPVNDPPAIADVLNQTTIEDQTTSPISISVSDLETPLANLILSAISSNPSLVPNSNIVLGGSGALRTMTLAPVANQSGTTTITLTLSDGAAAVTETFELTVEPINDSPIVQGLADVTIQEDSATSTLFFSVGDLESLPANLTVSVQSSNTALIPDANLLLSGTGTERSLQWNPEPNQFGTSTITVSVSDGGKVTAATFLITVTGVNDAPSISSISSKTVHEDQPASAVPFTIGDLETNFADLTVTITSSNLNLVPTSNVTLGGSGANRTLTVVPTANKFGLAVISVTVGDGQLTRSTSFSVIVNSVNDAPSFLLGPAPSGAGSVAPVVLPHWATGITTGPADELAQQIHFLVSTNNPALFSVAPAINAAGDLTYTLVPDANGQATVTVSLHDDGGTANGGVDTSAAQTFVINAIDDPLGFPPAGDPRQFAFGGPAVVIDPELQARDTDQPNVNYANGQLTVSITAGGLKTDLLSLPIGKKNRPPQGDIAVIGTNVLFRGLQLGTLQGGTKGAPLRIQFGSGATEASVNALLKALTFSTKGKQLADSNRTVRFELQDATKGKHAETARVIQVVRS